MMTRKKQTAMIILLVLVMLISGCSNREYVLTTAFHDDEVMRINTKSCRLKEFMLYLTNVQNQYANVFGAEIIDQNIDGQSFEERIKDVVVARIAQVKVMVLMAEDMEIELDEKEFAKVQSEAASYFNSLNDTEKEVLKVTYDDIVEIYSEYALATKLYDSLISDVDTEISDDEARTITVSQIFIKTYAYDTNDKRFEYTGKARTEAKELADSIHEQAIAEDGDFDALAAQYNEAEDTTISFRRGEKDAKIENACYALDRNAISDVIQTADGYWIFKCLSTFNVDETQLNKEKILDERHNKVFGEAYDAFVETLTKNLNRELFDSVTLIHDPQVTTSKLFDVNF